MKKRSIIEELNDYVSPKDLHQIIESRASNIIASAINLLEMMESNLSAEDAAELKNRMINSIRGRDPAKFTRKIREFREKGKK